MPAPILLIDNENLSQRGFYGSYRGGGAPVLSHNGFPTNMISMWISMAAALINRERFSRVIFVLDGKPVFRNGLFAEYKGTRKPKPPALVQQRPVVRELVETSGLEYAFNENEEADDIIGTLARELSAENDVFIASRDKDFAQCVTERVSQLKPAAKGGWERFAPPDVETFFGVRPALVPQYLALVGDTSDNIPGIPDVGEKRVGGFLRGDPSFDVLAERIASFKDWPLERAKSELTLNLQLTTIRSHSTYTLRRAASPQAALARLKSLGCYRAADQLAKLNVLLSQQTTSAISAAPKAAAQMTLF